MITKITGETPFQVLTNNFSISPSNEGYTLQISADGVNFSNLFSVGANVTRLVTGVAANSYYRLLGNQSAVQINWMKTCVTEGGGGASGTELQPVSEFPLADEGTVVAYTGSSSASGVYQYNGSEWVPVGVDDLSAYWNSAQTKTYVDSAITAVEDHLYDVEEVTASALTELHTGLLEVSARTSISSADVQTQIDASISGKADAASVSANTSVRMFPLWNEQGIVTGTTGGVVYERAVRINGEAQSVFRAANGDLTSFWAPTTSGETGQILMASGNTPVWITPATINGSAITSGGNIEIQGGGGITSADVKTQIEAYNYMEQTDAQVISTALNDLEDRKIESSDQSVRNIVKIEQSDYDTLVANSATTSTTLYVVVPDSQ